MLWATLALLGVPLWIVAGGLAVMFWSRSKFKKQDGVFATKMRLESGSAPGVGEKWPPMSSFALWVHDVLLVHKGLGLMNTSPLGVAGLEGSGEGVDPEEVKRLGENPVILRFRLDNGAVLQMAASGEALELVQGPFSTSEAPGEDRG
jgi:hypothetical protein